MIIPPTNPVKTVAITAISLMRVGSISKYSATPPQTPPIILSEFERYNFS